jgi:hypothetical protein
MADERTQEELESRAKALHAIQALSGDHVGALAGQEAWEALHPDAREGWIRLARAVPGVLVYTDATSSGWPVVSQVERVKELREKYLNEGGKERTWLVGGTRPYNDLILLFEHPSSRTSAVPMNSDVFRTMGFLIHPDGHYEELYSYRIVED